MELEELPLLRPRARPRISDALVVVGAVALVGLVMRRRGASVDALVAAVDVQMNELVVMNHDHIDDFYTGIDDFNHTACSGLEDRNDSSVCAAVDSTWCGKVTSPSLFGASGNKMLRWVGCDTCDDYFGPCLLSRIKDVQLWCDRLAGNESLWKDAVGRRHLDTTTPSPTPVATTLTDEDYTECDSKAYCEECASSSACAFLVTQAHAGNISGVPQNGRDGGDSWHAGQAYEMIMSLHYVCRFAREQGIVQPPNGTKSGGSHP